MRGKWKVSAAALLVAAGLAVAAVTAGPVRAGEMAQNAGEIVEHEVLKGDNLYLLAGYYFADPRQWRRIYSMNSQAISDPNLLNPGAILKVSPDLEKKWQIPYRDFLSRVRDR